MATINRFSRVNPAEFDPLTAQEVMAVPLLKQEIEDKQIAENRTILKDLYNTKALTGDLERVNKVRSDIEDRLNNLSDDIATNGISRDKTDKLTKLKLEYDKELSLQGTLGHAQAFEGKKEVARTNFMNTGLKLGWTPDKLNPLWEEHLAKQSAFGEEGELNQNFQELGLGKYEDPWDMVMNQVNIGKFSGKDAAGNTIVTNEMGLKSMANDLLVKFNTDGTVENRLAKQAGWSPEYIKERIIGAVGARTSKSIQVAAVLTDKQRAKDLAEINTQRAMDNENTISVQDTHVRSWNVKLSHEDRKEEVGDLMNELELAKKEGRDTSDITQKLQNTINVYSKVDEWFHSKGEGKNANDGINSFIDEQTSSEAAYMKEHLRRQRAAYTGADENNFPGTRPPEDKMAELDTRITKYNDVKNEVLKENVLASGKEFTFNSSIYNKPGQPGDLTDLREDDIREGFAKQPEGYSIISGNYIGDESRQTSLGGINGKNADKIKNALKGVLKNSKPGDISVRAQIPGSSLQEPGFRMGLSIDGTKPENKELLKELFPDKSYSDMEKDANIQYELNIGVPGEVNGYWKKIMTDGGLSSVNNRGKAVEEQTRGYYAWNHIPISGEDNLNFFNADKLKTELGNPNIGRLQMTLGESFSKDDKFDVYQKSNGKASIRIKDSSGMIRPVTMREAFSAVDFSNEEAFAKSVTRTDRGQGMVKLMKDLIKEDPRYQAALQSGQGVPDKLVLDIIGELRVSDKAIEANSKYDLFNIF